MGLGLRGGRIYRDKGRVMEEGKWGENGHEAPGGGSHDEVNFGSDIDSAAPTQGPRLVLSTPLVQPLPRGCGCISHLPPLR